MAKVHVAPEADTDIAAIFEYLLGAEGLEVAERLVEELDAAVQSLNTLPERGKYPPELLSAGITLFRELQCYPWRIFYRVVDGDVWIVAVLDGRRNIAQLLPERLAR
ncbi:MAG: type II toxin-antitoxin system RelE/ParE family toxin [Desulfovibrio sp.]|nr:type II toxin-antitoxin system RelE/ParE family toxin [Desulfovibrio sp.]